MRILGTKNARLVPGITACIVLHLLFGAPVLVPLVAQRALPALPQNRSVGEPGSLASKKTLVKQPVDYVDPNIGGIGHLLTSVQPFVQVPHGLVQIAPVVGADVTDYFLATKIYGFSGAGPVLMATAGPSSLEPENNSSEMDHDNETVTPYYASYRLDKYNIGVEYTAAGWSAYFRLHFPSGSESHLILSSKFESEFEIVGSSSVEGSELRDGVRTYFYIESPEPFVASVFSSGHLIPNSAKVSGANVGVTLTTPSAHTIGRLRIGYSFLDCAQAKRNLIADQPDWSFEALMHRTRRAWNRALGKIQIAGGTEEQRTIFYTALYRSLQFMKDITEADRFYGPYDHTVHLAQGRRFYIEDNLWDTYRTRHPLQLLIEPDREDDVLRSYLEMYRESGWMPHFPYMRGDLAYMIGNHAAAMFNDSYAKGHRDFDVESALDGLRKNALEATMLPDRRGPAGELERFYQEHGYFPALGSNDRETVADVNPQMRRQAVSVTLENAFDDWNIAELAKAVGRKKDEDLFYHRAANYRNVFNPATKYMWPRNSSGEFLPNVNPKWAGGQAGRDFYTECNGLVYTFSVQHDVAGLISLMGGRDAFVKRLDDLFTEGYDGELKFVFLSQFPDSTGLIGQYPQGNEPAFHIPYLYDYAGAPWKTQKRLRDILRVWFAASPLGLPGDDDNGETSSWYVFSAMGFYPVSPGIPIYALGSPIFRQVRIALGNGKIFTIQATHVSAQNKYIHSATMNGLVWNKPWFSHSDLINGGTLVLDMSSRPNKRWGASENDAPPSWSTMQSPRFASP